MVNYRELPEQVHWWDDPRSSGGRSDAVDNEEVLDFLRLQVRNQCPQKFNIRLFDLSINDTFYWIRVLSQQEALQQTSISAEVIGEKVLLDTENILAMEVDWGALNLPIKRIIWNQQQYSISDDSPMLLGPEPDAAVQLNRVSCIEVCVLPPFCVGLRNAGRNAPAGNVAAPSESDCYSILAQSKWLCASDGRY